MQTEVTEIAADIYRLSTFIPEANFMFNQFFVDAEEPLLFHTGPRALFPLVSAAVQTLRPLRPASLGDVRPPRGRRVRLDEPVAGGGARRRRSRTAPWAAWSPVSDLADRPPRPLADGEVLDLGGRRVRRIETPHVPHGWDAGVLYEETTGTLLCGDLLSAFGPSPATTEQEVVSAAVAAEELFKATCLTPTTAPTIRSLAALEPSTLAIMHGPTYTGDCVGALPTSPSTTRPGTRRRASTMAAPGTP